MNILITGATAGFGQAIARLLVKQGHKVIGTGRRQNKLDQLEQELGSENFYGLCFDVSKGEEAKAALATLPEDFATIDVLVNNAGLALGLDPVYENNLDDVATVINTNCLGLVTMTTLILPQMVKRNSGYIINLGSIAGNWPYQGSNVYGASKAFVRQFTFNARADLAGTNVRMTNLEPGLCGETEFSNVRFKGDEARANAVYENKDYLTPDDIADIVSYLIHLPPRVNINALEVMPTCQTFGGLKVSEKR